MFVNSGAGLTASLDEKEGYGEWRYHPNGDFFLRVYRYKPHPGARQLQEQYYIYLNPQSPVYRAMHARLDLEPGAFMYDPESGKVWGYIVPDAPEHQQYSVLRKEVAFADLPNLKKEDMAMFGPLPAVRQPSKGPLGPVLAGPPENEGVPENLADKFNVNAAQLLRAPLGHVGQRVNGPDTRFRHATRSCEQGYGPWRQHADGKYYSRQFFYKTPHGESRDQVYLYFMKGFPQLPWGAYLYNPRTKKIWGVARPEQAPGQQYALLDQPISWDELGSVKK